MVNAASSNPREVSKSESLRILFSLDPVGDANELGNQRHGSSPPEMGAAYILFALVGEPVSA
jgi:hypothetical protein